jgi:hypothetical protein
MRIAPTSVELDSANQPFPFTPLWFVMRHCISSSIAFALLMLALGLAPRSGWAVEFGSQSLPDGGVEYIVQVEPELLNSFPAQGITSDIPSNLQGQLRRIHLTIGTGPLPNQGQTGGFNAAPSGTLTPAEKSAVPSMGPSATNNVQPPTGNTGASNEKWNLPLPPGSETQNAKTDSATAPPSNPQAPLASSAAAPSKLSSATPPAELPSSLSGLPFFHHGPMKKLEPDATPAATEPPSGNDAERTKTASGTIPTGSVVAAGQSEQLSPPRLSENEVRPGSRQSFSNGQVAVDADKPAVSDSGWTAEKTDGKSAVSKPWLPLMATLLTLFASLGANAYLGWIHQGTRAKYKALLKQLPAGGAAAT